MILARTITASASAFALGLGLAMGLAHAGNTNTFRMMSGEPRFMDPNLATDYSIYVNAQLFEPLARIDEKGNLVLRQAKSIDLAPDGRTWTITLDPAYKWSNGDPVTAQDWVYSWKRILDPRLASEVAPF
ncbi:ABC transporter substrate-binding protein (plasmid) [Mesorhizobium terrae]